MKILITCPRAPISIEWIKIAHRSGHEVLLVDSLDYPIGAFYPNVAYIKVPSPKIDFEGYAREMEVLINRCDLVIPNCEDLFYLSKVKECINMQTKFFMPESRLLFEVHDKYAFFSRLNGHVKFPKTQKITCKEEIDFSGKTILKPVYSRFGRSVVRKVTPESVENLEITPVYPWVQQQFIEGEPLCNYALCEHGEVVVHAVYRPKYLLNQAASTYFKYHEDARCEAFVREFAKANVYHGQVAFDFIDDGVDLYVLECNPRATSGLHLVANALLIDANGRVIKSAEPKPQSYRVGSTLYLLFGWQALLKGEFLALHHDYQRAVDALKPLPWYAQFFALYEMLKRAWWFKKPLTSASTFDIEYDGEQANG
jgi:glutathione synthase/RimK-type ligase-like ATP-grasp enzyme